MPATGDRTPAQVTARIAARPEGLAEVHAAFERFFALASARGREVLRADRIAIVTAAAEIAANIVRHACAGLPDAWLELVVARRPDQVEVSFEDPGAPYVPRQVDATPLPQDGMGLVVARSSLETLEYARDGALNRWRLVRKTEEPPK